MPASAGVATSQHFLPLLTLRLALAGAGLLLRLADWVLPAEEPPDLSALATARSTWQEMTSRRHLCSYHQHFARAQCRTVALT